MTSSQRPSEGRDSAGTRGGGGRGGGTELPNAECDTNTWTSEERRCLQRLCVGLGPGGRKGRGLFWFLRRPRGGGAGASLGRLQTTRSHYAPWDAGLGDTCANKGG